MILYYKAEPTIGTPNAYLSFYIKYVASFQYPLCCSPTECSPKYVLFAENTWKLAKSQLIRKSLGIVFSSSYMRAIYRQELIITRSALGSHKNFDSAIYVSAVNQGIIFMSIVSKYRQFCGPAFQPRFGVTKWTETLRTHSA